MSLAEAFPDSYILESDSSLFDVSRYSTSGACLVNQSPDVHSQYDWGYDYRADYSGADPVTAWLHIDWEGTRLDVVSVTYFEGHCNTTHRALVGPNQEICERFFRDVCRWNSQVHGEVLVFGNGRWHKSKELFEAIKASTLENLVLAGDLKEQLADNIESFFASREEYEKHGIAWKRGILLLGPPGNGKTHAVKAIANKVATPCLYVRSFKAQYRTDHELIYEVFRHARDIAPCLLIFEDLDSLLDSGNRSFFLNEMDGFESNNGILTIATTNYPERLDPSILERPSRFDRKFTFDLPGRGERVRYLQMFSSGLEAALRVSDPEAEEIADATEGFSYAYLKELYLSSMMRWISEKTKPAIATLLLLQVENLRTQMNSEPTTEPSLIDEEQSSMVAARMARYMRTRG